MKTKIIKINNLACIMCVNKLSTVLNSIPEVYEYKINVLQQEIMIKYVKNLAKIIFALEKEGFEPKKIDLKTHFIFLFLIIIFKISYDILYIRILVLLILQCRSKNEKNLRFFRFFSGVSFLLYFVQQNEKNLDNSVSILIYIFVNRLITDNLNYKAKINSFSILERSKFRKLISEFTSECKFMQIQNVNNKAYNDTIGNKNTVERNSEQVTNQNNVPSVFYKIVDSVRKNELIYVKKNDKLYVTGTIIKGKCLVDNSANTGEFTLKRKICGDKLLEGMIVKKGKILVKIEKISSYCSIDKAAGRSFYNVFLVVINLITVFYAIYTCDNLPDILNYIVKFNMKICPCIFLISDVILKMRIHKEASSMNVHFNNLDVIKKIKCIFIDKTGTLTKNCEVVKYKIDDDITGVIYSLEMEFDNVHSRGILKVLKKQKMRNDLSDKEYVSSAGIRCKLQDDEIRIGKYMFCNYLNYDYKEMAENTIYVSVNSNLRGYFIMSEYIKKDAGNIIRILKNQYRLILLSGDTKRNVEEFCKRMNISEFYYNVNAKEKSSIIKTINTESCMVGDGLNDIDAFSVSSLSIGLKANLPADVTISNLKDLVKVLKIIRLINKKKSQNYMISIVYNVIIIFLNVGYVQSSILMYLPNLLIVINSLYI